MSAIVGSLYSPQWPFRIWPPSDTNASVTARPSPVTKPPSMTLAEALDTTRIYRVAGRTGDRAACVTTRPFRAPHHTISDVGLIGGGQGPLPGDVSLGHHGVLFEVPSPKRGNLLGV